jgi:hypothetical protein
MAFSIAAAAAVETNGALASVALLETSASRYVLPITVRETIGHGPVCNTL